jgi:DNA polymerase-3 subunit delta'
MPETEDPMIFDKIVGHVNQIQLLKGALRDHNIPSRALLFSGPSGVGKKLVAMAWAQGLLCTEKKKPCGVCSSCVRVEKGHHPDLMQVGLTEGNAIKIEQIRDIHNFVSLRAYENHGKVIIIDSAQALNPQGSNALLKTLEEPNPQCNFILVTHNRAAIISTIQSRCQKILFGGLSVEELKRILPQSEPWVLEFSQGRVDYALKLEDESFKKLKTQSLKVLKDMPHARTFEGFMSLVDLIEDRNSALFATQCWSRWVTTAAALKLNAPVNSPTEERSVVEMLSQKVSVKKLMDLGQKILRLEQDIHANINKSLAFEKFWLQAKECFVP